MVFNRTLSILSLMRSIDFKIAQNTWISAISRRCSSGRLVRRYSGNPFCKGHLQVNVSSSGFRGDDEPCRPPPGPVKISHKKMADL